MAIDGATCAHIVGTCLGRPSASQHTHLMPRHDTLDVTASRGTRTCREGISRQARGLTPELLHSSRQHASELCHGEHTEDATRRYPRVDRERTVQITAEGVATGHHQE